MLIVVVTKTLLLRPTMSIKKKGSAGLTIQYAEENVNGFILYSLNINPNEMSIFFFSMFYQELIFLERNKLIFFFFFFKHQLQ